ncbi:unnamed protein product [Tuber melanosporum]|jgi:hypothetical protein|uniref:(Perigord truffle) hypothetical protein n=1 Tax=Tuber melanosporum (strain Mel28) TaxID=656061 RepID=D5GGA2_TUBMM|nr:uncharacterized protein GSTUM_00007289001 [Tuber melanosporum]CAZ83545.1 unnamed protein product [Tuber melanosporum]
MPCMTRYPTPPTYISPGTNTANLASAVCAHSKQDRRPSIIQSCSPPVSDTTPEPAKFIITLKGRTEEKTLVSKCSPPERWSGAVVTSERSSYIHMGMRRRESLQRPGVEGEGCSGSDTASETESSYGGERFGERCCE